VEADAMSDPNDASGYSSTDLISQGFIHTPKLKALLENTRPVKNLNVEEFDAIVVAGGQAPMFTFADAKELQDKFVELYETGKNNSSALPRHGYSPLCKTEQW